MDTKLIKIQEEIDAYKKETNGSSVGELSDTFHSFNELYKQRTILLAFACLKTPYAWKSKLHEDGTMYDGMFVIGFPTPDGMITYHCDLEYWSLFKIPSIPHAPKFDGYTPEDVLDRIEGYIKSAGTELLNKNNLDKIEKIVEEYIIPVFGDNRFDIASFIGFYNF